ncbi:hypothetical protein [Noviherbaspirillum denitrificans]|uniref:Uncharacterized protein n=1 Tax=Noviherbaspirillum denitrificans TaxID=1968433 RepID=A0A254THN8_9BURK|nr:hypothetical protein [Noviherbaspirillum denitrificans]OWW20083.1 hypothetical protein AYR66_11850 [Noviherbaspirillum denitrificans]
MNTITIVAGAAVFSFGLYNAILRRTAPDKLSRLKAMKDLFGDKNGDTVHLLAYAVAPLVAGAVFLFAGSQGVSLF